MKILQLLPTLSYGDAVGNDVLALDDTLRRHGYETCIYAENIDKRIDKKIVRNVSELKNLKENDLILYHFSTGTKLNLELKNFPCKIVMRYHNVTPYQFFEGYNPALTELCWKGREQLKALKNDIKYCLADSEFNKHDLEELGFSCEIQVLPILIPFSDYEKEPDKTIIRRYKNDGYINILFTGRIAPNKKQEDIISTFYMYQKYYNPKSRLFIVGSYNGMSQYYSRLKDYTNKLNVNNVYFTGHIKFQEILAYYRVSDLFLCMSEHEGFCVPLVEAMFFNLPIIAYDSTAVGSTLGKAGVLIREKQPLETAGLINYILNHLELKEDMIQRGMERLKDFEHSKIEERFIKYIKACIEGKNEK